MLPLILLFCCDLGIHVLDILVAYTIKQNVILAVSTDRAHAVDFNTSYLNDGLRIEPNQFYQIMWDKNMLLPDEDPSNYTVCITWYLLASEWMPYEDIGNYCGTENKGYFESTAGFGGHCIDICPVIVSVKVDDASLTSLSQNYMEMQQSSIALWSGIFYYTVVTESSLKEFCDDWSDAEKIADDLQLRLRSCPRMLVQAKAPNSGFTEQKMTSIVSDTTYASQWMNYFHPLADVCFIQSSFTRYRICSLFVTL